MNIRGFEKVSDEQWEKDFTNTLPNYLHLIKNFERENKNLNYPKRATARSAGYDVFSPFEFILNPGDEIKIPTGFKAYMQDNEKLMFHTRSGNGFKYIRLANCTGIGDSDYYNNEDNEGHYWVKIRNEGETIFKAKVNTAIAQCIFEEYLLADNDDYIGNKRIGGLGSTN